MRPCSINAEDLAACRALLRTGSRSFFTAALLLPRRIQNSATALYAFCRVADDAIDEGKNPVAALQDLRRRLDAVYAGAPDAHAVDRAFAATVRRHEIPRALPEALIEGLAWDAAGRRHANVSELLDYAARVAGAVGVMMALIMGVRGSAALARAADLGVAMQLTNIARDIGEDARAGRLYLPLDWLAELGIDPEKFLAAPVSFPGIKRLTQRLLAEADVLYARAKPGIALLPLDCRPGIGAARRIYAGIGAELAGLGHDSLRHRARVPGRRKMLLAARALADAWSGPEAFPAPALPENLFLVSAAALDIAPELGGFVKIILLFDRLERAQRDAAGEIPA